MLKFIVFAALAATAASVSAKQLATTNEVIIIVTASDRADEAGFNRLMRKVSRAAEQVCGSYATAEYYQWDGIERCRAQAFHSVDRQLAALKPAGTIRLAAR